MIVPLELPCSQVLLTWLAVNEAALKMPPPLLSGHKLPDVMPTFAAENSDILPNGF